MAAIIDLADAREQRWLREMRHLLLALDDEEFVDVWKLALRCGATEAERRAFADVAIERDRARMKRAMNEAVAATRDLPRYDLIIEFGDAQ